MSDRLNTQDDDPARDIAISIQKFSSNLYPVMAKERKLLFSPFSIFFQLILLYLGAVEDTAVEMKQYMHLPFCKERLLMGMRKILRKLKQSSIKIIMEMFVHHSYKIRAKFRRDAMKFLSCNLRYVNFMEPEETTRLINSWASLNSNQKISNLIPRGVIDEFLELIVMGAFCLEGNWLTEFEAERTSKDDFFVEEDDPTEVEMMHISGQFYYLQKAAFKALVLPCKDKKLKLVVVLPREIELLTILEEKISELDVMRILEDAKPKEVRVTLPKFKKVRLNHKVHTQVQRAGLNIIFDPKRANFTDIHQLGQELVCVDYIKQKVMIEVNEKGIEVIVQLDGIEDKPTSFARKRHSDSELDREDTKRFASISEDTVISRKQPKEEEGTTFEEKATVSGLKAEKSEKPLITVPSSSFDEAKNYSENNQEEIEDCPSVMLGQSIPERELKPTVDHYYKELAIEVANEFEKIHYKKAVAIAPVENGQVLDLSVKPEISCLEIKNETHVPESSSTLNHKQLESNEGRVSTTELMKVDLEKAKSVEQSMIKQEVMIEVNEKRNEVQPSGLENKITSPARKREADSGPILQRTEKVAKISEDSVIPSLQPNEEEVRISEEAVISKLAAKESEKPIVSVSSFNVDEKKTHSENDPKTMEDYSNVELKQSIPKRRNVFEGIENIISKESPPLAEFCHKEIASRVDIETNPENNTEAIARVKNGKRLKNVSAMSKLNRPEIETETHVRDSSSKLSDAQLENVEERISTTEQVKEGVVDSIIVEETGIVEKAMPAVSKSSVQESNTVESCTYQMEVIDLSCKDIPPSLKSHNEETKRVPPVMTNNVKVIPELVRRMDEVKIKDSRAETKTNSVPSTSEVSESVGKEIEEILQRVVDDVEKVSEGTKEEAEITSEDMRDQNESCFPEENDVLWQDYVGTPDEQVSNFIANHPFIYYVLHDCSILVIGKYLNIE